MAFPMPGITLPIDAPVEAPWTAPLTAPIAADSAICGAVAELEVTVDSAPGPFALPTAVVGDAPSLCTAVLAFASDEESADPAPERAD